MNLQLLYSILCYMAAGTSTAFLVYAWRFRTQPGTRAFMGLMACGGVWAFFSPLILLAPSVAAAHVFYDLLYLATAFIPVLFFTFVLQYTGRGQWLTRGRIAALLVIPILTQFVIWMRHDEHGLFHTELAFNRIDGLNLIAAFQPGPWFILFASYSYLLMFFGMALLVITAWHASGVYRRQIIFFLAAFILPVTVDFLETVQGLDALGVSLTPLAFVIASAFMGWNLFRYHFLDLVPIARSALVDSIGDAMLAVDTEGRVVDANTTMSHFLGRPRSTLIGRPLADALEPWLEYARRYEGQSEISDEITITLGDQKRHFDLRLAPLRDAGGDAVGQLLTLRDISERKRAENDLRRYARELETSNAELDAFAQTVAHDLKSPLATLMGFVALLDRETDLPAREMEEIRAQILRQGQKMTSIVDELLLLASVRRSGDITLEKVDMKVVVVEALERLKSTIAASGATVTMSGRAQWPVALGYAPWLEEVWVNYLSNAIKYGGEPPEIEIGATPVSSSRIRFWVHDNGAGLTAEDQALLFTEFTRLHARESEGHGLGLSIVRRIVEKLGGEVGVESTPGVGSTFYFTLPRSHHRA